MGLLRPIIVLVIFFGILFYFKGPLQNAPAQFGALHSSYVASFKQTMSDIFHASSSSWFSGSFNYIPGMAGSYMPSMSTSTTSGVQPTVGSSMSGQQTSSTSTVLSTSSEFGLDTKGDLLPVVSNQGILTATLSVSGIVSSTNKERTKQGLAFLALDPELSKAAESKLQDMFQNQYFQHVSPSGETVSDVVKKVGYQYIVVGENLALGIFGGDAQVVVAWMASPGHRKNILDSRYQDIGVAVGQGMYQGKKQWLIVQHFGKPITACTSPSEALKKTIDMEKNNLVALETRVTNMKIEVERLTGDAYTAKAIEYNGLVIDYNNNLNILKKNVEEYNVTARVFNTCAGITN